MHTVKSKYKNPDEYIRRLKAKIKLQRTWIDEDRERRKQLHGTLIVSWDKSATEDLLCTTRILGDLHAGDEITIYGKILIVKEFISDDGSFHSSINYRLLETRRIKE